ncbi:hypothetical protein AVEN_51993-1 [Araneus ventricosus]|uniref:Uncharacterized protein n=1 Tax=Araneus ventricosus TaxID=182803 RepID=A0A4Y2CG35_ARAVE|nr:hypothetical protein AVEN_51993-1 [Araneus ventricosus]
MRAHIIPTIHQKTKTTIKEIEFTQKLLNADLQNVKPGLYDYFRRTHLHVELEAVVAKTSGELALISDCAFPDCSKHNDIENGTSPWVFLVSKLKAKI